MQPLFNQVWGLWYVFALHPNRALQNPQQECSKRVKNAIQAVRKHLRRDLKKLSSDTLHVRIASETILWEENPALWRTIDGKNSIEVCFCDLPVLGGECFGEGGSVLNAIY